MWPNLEREKLLARFIVPVALLIALTVVALASLVSSGDDGNRVEVFPSSTVVESTTSLPPTTAVEFDDDGVDFVVEGGDEPAPASGATVSVPAPTSAKPPTTQEVVEPTTPETTEPDETSTSEPETTESPDTTSDAPETTTETTGTPTSIDEPDTTDTTDPTDTTEATETTSDTAAPVDPDIPVDGDEAADDEG